MEATFPLEDDRNRDKRSDAPQASGSRVSSLSLLLVEHCERRDRNGYKGGVRRALVRRLLCHALSGLAAPGGATASPGRCASRTVRG